MTEPERPPEDRPPRNANRGRGERASAVHLLELVAILAAFLCILFRHAFASPFYYFAADTSELYYPYWVFTNQSLHSGGFPLLNPFWFAGSLPFAPLETSVFYPPLLTAQLFFDARQSLDTAFLAFFSFQLLHYVLGGVMFYAFARIGLRLNRAAALFGGVVFCCSGSFVGHYVHVVYLYTLPLLPLLFLCYLLFLRRRTLVYAIATAGVLALVVVAGHPQFVFNTFAMFGLTAVYASLVLTKRDRDLVLAFSFLIVVLALMLAAFKVFLTLELSGQIVRTAGETTIRNLYNSLHPLYYLTLLAPYLFGRHRIGYWGSEYPWGNWENFLYIGILPLLFLPLALKWRRKRLLGLFACGLALTIFLLLGRYWAPSAFVNRHLPFASTFSNICKMTLFTHFFLVVMVAIGFHVATEELGNRKVLGVFLGWAFVLAAILFVGLRAERVGGLQPAGRPPPSPEALLFAQRSLSQGRLLFGISTAAALGLLLARKRWAFRLVLPVYAFDLLLTASDFNPIDGSVGRASQHFGQSAILQEIQKDRSAFRVGNLSWPQNLNMVRSVESLSGYHTVATVTYRDMEPLLDPHNKAVLDLMNVKYFLSDSAATADFERVVPGLFRNRSAMERVEWVPSVRYVETKGEMTTALTSPAFDPRREVLLYRSASPLAGPVSRPPRTAPPKTARVRITGYQPTRVRVEMESETPGFLLFSQPRYPGWRARIDGRWKPLFPADLSLYALPVEPGAHTIEFAYRSGPLLWGLAVAGATTLLLIACFASPRIRPVLLRPFNEWGPGRG